MKGVYVMARAPRYEVNNKAKTITAYVDGLNQTETKRIANYLALGYKLIPVDKVPNQKQIYKKDNILKFIKEKEIKDINFEALMNELNDKGTKKGFVYALKVFRAKYDKEFIAWNK